MKKFVFELQEVLDIRKFEQQIAESELGKALAAENQIQQQLDALAQKQVQVQSQMKGSVNFTDIANANQFYTYVRNTSEQLLQQLAEAKLVSDQKREVLKSCMQKTDALERLKETQEQEFKQEVKAKEAKEIDDITNGRFGRQF